MRLLNSKTLQLKEFKESFQLKYAILSHRWGDEEISLQDITSADPSIQKKKGYDKVKGCCEQAYRNGLDWVWIDTCCIDKSSSAELSEAINSMYRWYQRAALCYVYLFDVTYLPFDFDSTLSEFRASEWFKRGWTLQELIAPQDVRFFDKHWSRFGTKRSLEREISAITNIYVNVLDGTEKPQTRSVAERMSWASWRETTRPEDEAYCLLGFFDVSMPLLYGEGRRAFQRLQQEILKQDEDYTILAWLLTLEEGVTPPVYHVEKEVVKVGIYDNNTSILSPNSRSFRYSVHGPELGQIVSLEHPLLENEPLDVSRMVSLSIGRRFHGHPDTIVPFYSVLGMTPETMPPPPVITSRGLKATLFVWKQEHRLLAWTSCLYLKGSPDQSLLLCMEIEAMGSSAVYQRTNMSAELYTLDVWKNFKTMELYLSLNYDPSPRYDDHQEFLSQMNEDWDVGGVLSIYLSDSCPGSITVRSTEQRSHDPCSTHGSHIPPGAATNVLTFDQSVHSHGRANFGDISSLVSGLAVLVVRWKGVDSEHIFGIATLVHRGPCYGLSCRLLSFDSSVKAFMDDTFWRDSSVLRAHDTIFRGQGTIKWPMSIPELESDRYSMRLADDAIVVLNTHMKVDCTLPRGPFVRSSIEVVIELAKRTPIVETEEVGSEEVFLYHLGGGES